MSTSKPIPLAYSPDAIGAGKKIERVIVDHPGFVRAKNQLRRLSDGAHNLKDPGGLVILGESGTGKDSLIEEMKAIMPSSELLNSSRRPLVIVHTEATPSVGDFVGKMLAQLGYTFAKLGNADNQERRDILVSALVTCHVQLILVNEFQHVIEGRREKMGHNLTDWFKRLYDDTRVPMAFLGTPALARALEINEQFASRFSGRYRLKPLGKTPDYLGVLRAFDSAIPELRPTGLEMPRFSNRIHDATGGVMRPLKRLIREAVMIAMTMSEQKLTLGHFKEAYERIQGDGVKENPFNET